MSPRFAHCRRLSRNTHYSLPCYLFIYTHFLQVACIAWSGIAANLLPNGQTVHSFFKLPMQLSADSTCNISTESSAANRLRSVRVIIWDEAPMALCYAVDIIDRTLQFLCENSNPFGGKTVILGGDFRQV